MADKSDKQFDPTPRRLQKAKEDGNVFKSQETTAVGMLAVGFSGLVLGAPLAFGTMGDLMAWSFAQSTTTSLDVQSVGAIMKHMGLQATLMLAPFLAAMMVAAVGITVAQSGFNVSLKPLEPKPNKVSPLSGIKRIFSAKGLFQFGKSIVKIALVGPIAYVTISGHLPEILNLHMLPMQAALATAAGWIVALIAKMVIALALLSALDFAFEKWKYKEDLKMSHQEIKDESKDTEGNPEVKGKQRQKAREAASRPRILDAVLQADVVIKNPTHYAVALKYDPGAGGAPRVLVKGIRKRALRILETAAAHDVPTVENRPLVRALYAQVEEEHEIPEELYPAVAAILAEVYRQQGRM